MAIHPLAGKPAPADILIDVDRLEKAYYGRKPDPEDPQQLVSFGTSGHRGSPLDNTLNEAHILAITQAICEYRASQNISGPLFMGKTRMRYPARRRRVRSKCSPPTAWKRSFSATTVSPPRRQFRERS